MRKNIKMYSTELSRDVDIYIYLPKSYDGEKSFPVVYMHDGQNLSDPELTTYGDVWQVEDAFNYKIRELIVVGISSPVGGTDRWDELCPYESDKCKGLGKEYLDFVSRVVNYIDLEFKTFPSPENRLLMGSSLGGLITTYAAAHYTDIYSNFACVSNAYWFDERILDEVPKIKDVKFYMDVGTAEGKSGYVELNDRAYSLLNNKDSMYVKVPGAIHNEQEWAVRLPMILRWFFGGQK